MVLSTEIAFKRLYQTLGLWARLALGLDKFSSTNAALVITHIRPARLQTLRRLTRFQVGNTMYDFIGVAKEELRITYAFPREIGRV